MRSARPRITILSLTFSLVLVAFSSQTAFAKAHEDFAANSWTQPTSVSNNVPIPEATVVECAVDGSYFRVWTKDKKFEKYVSGTAVDYSCGRNVAAAVIGSYFIFFDGERFQEKYVSGFSAERLKFEVRENMAAAVMGSYLVYASQASKGIKEKYVGTSDADHSRLMLTRSSIVAIMGNYIVSCNGVECKETYVGSELGRDPLVSDSQWIVAIVSGSYIYGVNGLKVTSRYVNSSQPRLLESSGKVAAALMGNYFVIFDADRDVFLDVYVGNVKEPSVKVNRAGTAVLRSSKGIEKIYSTSSGKFSIGR